MVPLIALIHPHIPAKMEGRKGSGHLCGHRGHQCLDFDIGHFLWLLVFLTSFSTPYEKDLEQASIS